MKGRLLLLYTALVWSSLSLLVTGTIYDIAVLNELVVADLVALAGLDVALANPEATLTLFAPENDAFDDLPPRVSLYLMNTPDVLSNILLGHVAEGNLTSAELTDISGTNIEFLNEAEQTIAVSTEGDIFVGTSKVVEADIFASNGVIHLIDALLGVPSILEWVNENSAFLSVALITSNIDVDTLDDVSVFAPTDEAFSRFATGYPQINAITSGDYGDGTLHLAELILFHVSGGTAFSSDFMDGQPVESLQGLEFMVTVGSEGQIILSPAPGPDGIALIEQADIVTTQGVVHVIDQVLLPPFVTRSVLDVIQIELVTLSSLVAAAGLESALNSELVGITLFAPNEDAFGFVDLETVEFLTSEEGQDSLIRILSYHIVPQVIPSSAIVEPAEIETLTGDTIFVSFSFGDVLINDAVVVGPDALANNGIVHIIDFVLEPPPLPPSVQPTPQGPTPSPTQGPTQNPSLAPTSSPITPFPTGVGTPEPPTSTTIDPTTVPTVFPSGFPTTTTAPAPPTSTTSEPTAAPSFSPSAAPTTATTTIPPTLAPVVESTENSDAPSLTPIPTIAPTSTPVESMTPTESGAPATGLPTMELPTTDAPVMTLLPTDSGCGRKEQSLVVCITELSCLFCLEDALESIPDESQELYCTSFETIMCEAISDCPTCSGCAQEAQDFYDCVAVDAGCPGLDCANNSTVPSFSPTTLAPMSDAIVPTQSAFPSSLPSANPTFPSTSMPVVTDQTERPTHATTFTPTTGPTATQTATEPTLEPTTEPTLVPTRAQTAAPSVVSFTTADPTSIPTTEPTRSDLSNVRLSLVEVVAQTFPLQQLDAYLNSAGLVTELSTMGPFTLMAPWDGAFGKLDPVFVTKLQTPAWNAHLQELLRYHVFDGDLPIADLPLRTVVGMQNGQEVTVTRREGTQRVRVNDILAVAPYDASNGFAYMLDQVLLPAWVTSTLRDVVTGLPELSTLASLLTLAGLDQVLADAEGVYTILAPDNTAVEGLGQETIDFLLSDAGQAVLQETLLYHVLESTGPIPLTLFDSSQAVPTLATGGITLTLVPGQPTATIVGQVNGASVLRGDQVANNGLVHVIDTVLLLE